MRAARAGTFRRIHERLVRHEALMQQYRAEGMSFADASARAYEEITGRPSTAPKPKDPAA